MPKYRLILRKNLMPNLLVETNIRGGEVITTLEEYNSWVTCYPKSLSNDTPNSDILWVRVGGETSHKYKACVDNEEYVAYFQPTENPTIFAPKPFEPVKI